MPGTLAALLFFYKNEKEMKCCRWCKNVLYLKQLREKVGIIADKNWAASI
jgi:hypothetical protein